VEWPNVPYSTAALEAVHGLEYLERRCDAEPGKRHSQNFTN